MKDLCQQELDLLTAESYLRASDAANAVTYINKSRVGIVNLLLQRLLMVLVLIRMNPVHLMQPAFGQNISMKNYGR